jgi:hypothetical protein
MFSQLSTGLFDRKLWCLLIYLRRVRDLRCWRRALAPELATGPPAPAPKLGGAGAFIPKGGVLFPFVGLGFEKPLDAGGIIPLDAVEDC